MMFFLNHTQTMRATGCSGRFTQQHCTYKAKDILCLPEQGRVIPVLNADVPDECFNLFLGTICKQRCPEAGRRTC